LFEKDQDESSDDDSEEDFGMLSNDDCETDDGVPVEVVKQISRKPDRARTSGQLDLSSVTSQMNQMSVRSGGGQISGSFSTQNEGQCFPANASQLESFINERIKVLF
jgi:hypothetical protein